MAILGNFLILNSEYCENLRKKTTRIRKSNLGPEVKSFLVARNYSKYARKKQDET